MLILSNEIRPDGTAVGGVDAGDFWHSDSSHHEEPCKATILYSVRNPSRGGDTEFCNMYMVYDALPTELKRQVAGRYGIHHVSKTRNPRVTISPDRPGAKDYYERRATETHEVRQPLVRTHPETGRQALYISPRFTIGHCRHGRWRGPGGVAGSAVRHLRARAAVPISPIGGRMATW